MPTYLRLIIMLGEVIGFLAFTIIRFIQVYHKEDGIEDKSEIVLASICNAFLIIGFIFGFWKYTFLSYNKMIFLSLFIISIIIFKVAIVIDDNHESISTIMFCIGMIGAIAAFVIILISFFNPNFIPFKTCINEEKYMETINTEIHLTSESKVGYTLDDFGNIDTYVFFYQDNNGKWKKVDESISDTRELSNDKGSYVEKYVTTRTILNHELNESDDNYITTEEIVTYILYYNQNELIEITD